MLFEPARSAEPPIRFGNLETIFKNNSNTWSQIGNTIYGNPHNNKGYSVSLSNNGNTLAIGSIYSPGTTYVYEYK